MKYTEIICNKLNEAGVKDWDSLGGCGGRGFDEYSEFIKNISCLPEENLRKMSELDVTKCKTLNDFIQLSGRDGLLKCDVMIKHTDKNPALMLRYNRYLHLFRGHTYQVSETVDGIGTWSTPYWGITNVISIYRELGRSDLAYLLMCASAIDSAGKLDSFWKDDSRSPVDVFWDWMEKSLNYFGVYKCSDGKNVYSKYVKQDTTFLLADTQETVYQFVKKDKVWARAYFNKDRVAVQTCMENQHPVTYYVDIPKWLDNLEEEEEEDREYLEGITEEFGKPNEVQFRLLNMLLMLAGINLNSVGWYMLRKLSPLRAMNFTNHDKVQEIDDILEYNK